MIRLVKVTNNLYRVELPDIDIWFSYEVPIAFKDYRIGKNTLNISKNIWSSTTAKHLNLINPDKSIRIDNVEFIKLLEEALK